MAQRRLQSTEAELETAFCGDLKQLKKEGNFLAKLWCQGTEQTLAAQLAAAEATFFKKKEKGTLFENREMICLKNIKSLMGLVMFYAGFSRFYQMMGSTAALMISLGGLKNQFAIGWLVQDGACGKATSQTTLTEASQQTEEVGAKTQQVEGRYHGYNFRQPSIRDLKFDKSFLGETKLTGSQFSHFA